MWEVWPDLAESNQVEMAQVAVSYEGAASSRSAHGCYKLHFCHGAEDVVPPIPASHVHELPQQLNRWLQHTAAAYLVCTVCKDQRLDAM